MRIYKQMDKIIFNCTRKLSKLVYTKKGHYKKGLNKKQIRRYLRTQYVLKNLRDTRAEGTYKLNGVGKE